MALLPDKEHAPLPADTYSLPLFIEESQPFALDPLGEELEPYEQAAARGDISAMLYLARFYTNGRDGDVSPDFEQARRWFEKAAALGDADALNGLGTLYHRGGFGIERDLHQARRFYQKAAGAGSLQALCNLGLICEEEGYDERALQCFERAAGRGFEGAREHCQRLLHRIARRYHDGSPDPDYRQARRWYEQAAALGSAPSMYNLGLLYEKGGFGLDPDHSTAIEWYEKAAAAGDPDAPNSLVRLRPNPSHRS